MTSDLDSYRTASVLIREHGEDAALEDQDCRTNSTAARASEAVMSGLASRTALTVSSVCVR